MPLTRSRITSDYYVSKSSGLPPEPWKFHVETPVSEIVTFKGQRILITQDERRDEKGNIIPNEDGRNVVDSVLGTGAIGLKAGLVSTFRKTPLSTEPGSNRDADDDYYEKNVGPVRLKRLSDDRAKQIEADVVAYYKELGWDVSGVLEVQKAGGKAYNRGFRPFDYYYTRYLFKQADRSSQQTWNGNGNEHASSKHLDRLKNALIAPFIRRTNTRNDRQSP